MSLPQLLQELEQKSIQLSVVDGKLTYSAPAQTMNEGLKVKLRHYKQALLDLHDTSIVPPTCEQRPSNVAHASVAQHGLWFIDQLQVPAETYAVHLAWHCHGDLNFEHLQRALDMLVQKHETLRTRFSIDEYGELAQSVNSSEPVSFEIHDLEDTEYNWRTAANNFISKPFKLSADQLLRAAVYRLSDQKNVVVLVTHHIAVDGWSVDLLTRNLESFYAALASDQAIFAVAPAYQYLEYSNWQRELFESDAFERRLNYWRKTLRNELPLMGLPFDHPRPAVSSYRGGSIKHQLDSRTFSRLTDLAKQADVTLYTLLLTAFNLFLHRYTGDEELVIGTPVANRSHHAWSEVVGLFTNTLVIRTSPDKQGTFSDYLMQVQHATQEAFAAQEVPFETLVRELAPDRDLSINPLYQVMFVLQNASGNPLKLPEIEVEPITNLGSSPAKFDLALEITVRDNVCECHFNYSCDLFDAHTINAMASYFDTLLNAIPEHLNTPVQRIPLISDRELNDLLVLGQGAVIEQQQNTLPELFKQQVSAHPGREAFYFRDKRYSYQNVAELQTQISYELLQAGCQPGDVVAVCLPRSVELISSILAVLDTGALWCPIEPDYPEARMRFMLDDSGAHFIVRLDDGNLQIDTTGVIRSVNSDNPMQQRYQGEAAYLFYTSGSSGVPKGVIGTHQGIANRLQWMWRYHPFEKNEKVCIKTSICFIDSIWECFGALLQGIPSVIYPSEQYFDANEFINLIKQHKISRIVLVPSLLSTLLDEMDQHPSAFSSVISCITSGEPISSQLAQRFYKHLPHARLLNLYGLSEVTADATYFDIPSDIGDKRIPLGKPIDNMSIYVLDEQKHPVLQGINGDIYIAGAGLALGYHAQPELTNAAFKPNPYGSGLMFKTGDRGHWNTEGQLEFVGRLDRQCKIRGIRMNLEEVESALETHPALTRAVVYTDEHTAGPQLVARVEVPTDTSVNELKLKLYLKDRLPAYLIPVVVTTHEGFPELPNGKIDQRTLRQMPSVAREQSKEGDEELTNIEQDMLDLWQSILKIPTLSIDDNFFDIGGHSLLAVKLVRSINKKFDTELSISSFFGSPTPRMCVFQLNNTGDSGIQTSSWTMLRSGGGLGQIFMIPPAAFTSIFYQSLSNALPTDVGLYSVDVAVTVAYESIESLSTQLAMEIRQKQPHGPWHLGGTCFGTHIAFETARQLQQKSGDEVFLFLIDSRAPLSGPTWNHQETRRKPYESRVMYYAKVLLHEYRHDRLQSFINRKRRRLFGLFNSVSKEYNLIWQQQSSQYRLYKAKKGNATIILFLSEQFQKDKNIIKRWQELSTKPICIKPIAARHHDHLTSPNSPHWHKAATELTDYMRLHSHTDT